MKLPHVLQNLLTNKIVLNIVCVLSALNMIGYLVTNNLTAILFFIVLAILIVQFNKNMIKRNEYESKKISKFFYLKKITNVRAKFRKIRTRSSCEK